MHLEVNKTKDPFFKTLSLLNLYATIELDRIQIK